MDADRVRSDSPCDVIVRQTRAHLAADRSEHQARLDEHIDREVCRDAWRQTSTRQHVDDRKRRAECSRCDGRSDGCAHAATHEAPHSVQRTKRDRRCRDLLQDS